MEALPLHVLLEKRRSVCSENTQRTERIHFLEFRASRPRTAARNDDVCPGEDNLARSIKDLRLHWGPFYCITNSVCAAVTLRLFLCVTHIPVKTTAPWAGSPFPAAVLTPPRLCDASRTDSRRVTREV